MEEKVTKTEPQDNQHLWDRFVRLGERIGDGDLEGEDKRWYNREYSKLSRILIPEIREHDKEKRKLRAKHVNESIAKLIINKNCSCGGTLRQSRSGSKILYCNTCNARYKATSKKSK